MVTDDTAPATKLDIRLLMEEIAKLYVANERWKEELKESVAASEPRMALHFAETEQNMKLYFYFSVETIRHDLIGANRDEISGIKGRLTRVEQKVGIRR